MKSENESAQLCPTLCDPMDFLHGSFQARVLEWVALAFSGSIPRAPTTLLVYPYCSVCVCVSIALKWFHTRNFGMLELEEGNLRGADWQYAGTGLMRHKSESTAE